MSRKFIVLQKEKKMCDLLEGSENLRLELHQQLSRARNPGACFLSVPLFAPLSLCTLASPTLCTQQEVGTQRGSLSLESTRLHSMVFPANQLASLGPSSKNPSREALIGPP